MFELLMCFGHAPFFGGGSGIFHSVGIGNSCGVVCGTY